MCVLRIIEYQCRETIRALQAILALAIKGKLRGVVICYRDEDGHEATILTGIYKQKPSVAVQATIRMSMLETLEMKRETEAGT